ncbi:hypothetical protein L596_020669 [Steinernema carpocapsae]|uniref:Uncharacterized protein n=1 Tax=Steinernema carpocapsae TaxID=34508 RepID=A0A4U5MUW5_STECR|nr:hypothetical protein L596_020669 [Steinernema carpocapsae]
MLGFLFRFEGLKKRLTRCHCSQMHVYNQFKVCKTICYCTKPVNIFSSLKYDSNFPVVRIFALVKNCFPPETHTC